MSEEYRVAREVLPGPAELADAAAERFVALAQAALA